jgi:hypothetical protein
MTASAPNSTRARPAPRAGGFGSEPNPLLLRELRQSLRVPRLPWAIAAAVAILGFGMISFSSREGLFGRPAQLGASIFAVFVNVLLLYVGMVGPATAATAIASEREGRTLEPLLLTGLSPLEIARGKFLAAYGMLTLQVVAMLPLAAVPLLFGGVGTSELVVATVWVLVFAAVAVAFGLMVASRAQTMRGALAVSIILPATTIPPVIVVISGIGEVIASRRWPFLTGGATWWTGAYGTAKFDLDYALFFLAWPIALVVLALWLCLTLTAANLASPNEDRSSGWKRWLVGATATIGLLVFFTALRFDVAGSRMVAIFGQVLTSALAMLGVWLVAAEPLSPTRLVRARWERRGTAAIFRATGPGVIRGAFLQIACTAALLAACFAALAAAISSSGPRAWIGVRAAGSALPNELPALGGLLFYTLTFDVFLVGLASFARARKGGSTANARGWSVTMAVLATLLPWLVALLTGSFDRGGRSVLVAAPSPAFAVATLVAQWDGRDDASMVPASFVAALAWGVLGLVLLGLAWDRARKDADETAAVVAHTEKAIARDEEEGTFDDDDDEPEDRPPPPPPPATVIAAPAVARDEQDDEPSAASS